MSKQRYHEYLEAIKLRDNKAASAGQKVTDGGAMKSAAIQGKQREIPLTLFEKGITAVPTAYSPLMDDEAWWAAKRVDHPLNGRVYSKEEKQSGAERIVNALWTEEKTRELQARIGDREPVFITVPSTSRTNALVPVFAEILCAHLGLGKYITVIEGETVSKRLHSEPMKNVPRENRPYVPREYILLSPQALRQQIAGRTVVVVEDVFSSGASAKGFCDTLAEARIQVATVVGLLGDSRLDCEPQLVSKLQRALKHAGISVKSKDVAAVLSRGQVNILIDNINKARGKDEYARIAENIQGILDSRAARHLGEDSWRPRQEHSHADDERTRRLREGVRTHIHSTESGGTQSNGRGEAQPGVNNGIAQNGRDGGRGR